jgi:hypothetical protein
VVVAVVVVVVVVVAVLSKFGKFHFAGYSILAHCSSTVQLV